jgi:hypothetical protein
MRLVEWRFSSLRSWRSWRFRNLACLTFAAVLSLPSLTVAQKVDSSPYQEGIRLLRAQDWSGAAKVLERAVKLEPRNVEAHIALGIALLPPRPTTTSASLCASLDRWNRPRPRLRTLRD